MLNQYHPNIKATIALVRLLKVKVNNTTVNETLQNHPDWPSLLCVSDSLHQWNISNAAGRIDSVGIDQLPLPFIACVKNGETPLHIVTAVNDTTITYLAKDYKRSIGADKEGFISNWDGVYLIAEPNEQSGEKNYRRNRSEYILNTLMPVAALLLLAIISVVLLQQNIVYQAIGIYLEYLLLFAGVIVTTLLLWYEIDRNNALLKKVCTGIAKGNCNAILTGKHSKLFTWLSWSEIGSFYFAGSMLALLFIPNSIYIIAWLHILALPYTIFSIYYQWRVAKQWCLLCLAVQTLLVLGAVNAVANQLLASVAGLSISLWLMLLVMYALPLLVWYSIKPYILQMQQSKNTKREYLRIKFNCEIFETLLNRQKHITINTEGIGIDLGNPNAENILIKISDILCDPCKATYPKIEKLLDSKTNLRVKIIFRTPNKPENSSYKPTEHVMLIAENNNEITTRNALKDWYYQERDHSVLYEKYAVNNYFRENINEKIAKMYSWCQTMDAFQVPSIFFNGKELPEIYSVEDLIYFI